VTPSSPIAEHLTRNRPAVGLAPHLQTPAAEWAFRPLALAFVPCRVRKHAADLFHQLEALGERTLALFEHTRLLWLSFQTATSGLIFISGITPQ
jgi:hypothetical protein